MNIRARITNIYFWLGLVGVIFSAAGIDFSSLTSWHLFWESLKSIIGNPVAIISVIMAVLGVFIDTSTPGLNDNGTNLH